MENNYLMRLIFKFFLIASLQGLLLMSGCKTSETKEQVLTLSQRQTGLTHERDSLIRLVVQKSEALDFRNTDYNELTAGKLALETTNKLLQSALYFRDKQLKTVKQANEKMDSTIVQENVKNDSLMKEITSLQQKILMGDAAVDKEQKTNKALAQSLKEQEEKRITDSIALENIPKPEIIKYGFINITEIGGGLGLGQTEIDFSRRVISLNNVFGYEIDKHFITGVGVGINFYNGGALIPLYIDMRYNFNGRKSTAFIVADGGVMFSLDKFSESGVFINPQIGIKKKLNERVSLNLSTGILLQQAPASVRNTFINLKGGVSFKGQ